MGRTVSTPYNVQETAYQDVTKHDHDSFQWWLEDITEYAKSLWLSFCGCDKWLDREDHAILENNLCYLGVSEYCGLVAIWLVPKENPNDGYFSSEPNILPLAENFINRIAPNFHKAFGQYRKIGTFSNGEAIYEKTA
jgi:hypothetical protein